MRPENQSMVVPLIPASPTRYLPLGTSPASGMEASAFLLYCEQTILKNEGGTELGDIVNEIFKEELSDRAQARRYLWEFFD
ncbi:MAG: hypothetical protein ACLGSD_03995 [Acidobacteriota bacterium]